MTKWISIVASTIVLAIANFSFAQTSDQIYIKIGEATVKKSLLALPPFQNMAAEVPTQQLATARELYEIVVNDLDVSNYFAFIKADAYLEDPMKVGLKPAPGVANGFDFAKWKSIGTEFLIRGGYRVAGGEINLDVYVYYVPKGELVFGRTYKSPSSQTRKLAHTFANDVVKALTGKPGMFLSRVVMSSTYKVKPFKEIFTMDWDGENMKQISDHKSVSLSPAWSPDGSKVAYTSFVYSPALKSRNASLFLYDLLNKNRWMVSFQKGINSGANFMPSGLELLLTISKEGTPDIYRITSGGTSKSQLTSGPAGAMNVEPAISPDGKRIAFSSDRGGWPMIYVMDVGGGNIKRLTFAGKYNASPTWSPDGNKLAFAGFDKTHFDIFMMNADGTDLSRLTTARKPNGKGANNEDPTFSPDGRHIMFTSDRTGNYQLYIVSPDGVNERRITKDSYNYSKPRWSANSN
jgi:TolB protein